MRTGLLAKLRAGEILRTKTYNKSLQAFVKRSEFSSAVKIFT